MQINGGNVAINSTIGNQVNGGSDWLDEPCPDCGGTRWTDVRPEQRRATRATCGMVRDWSHRR